MSSIVKTSTVWHFVFTLYPIKSEDVDPSMLPQDPTLHSWPCLTCCCAAGRCRGSQGGGGSHRSSSLCSQPPACCRCCCSRSPCPHQGQAQRPQAATPSGGVLFTVLHPYLLVPLLVSVMFCVNIGACEQFPPRQRAVPQEASPLWQAVHPPDSVS